VTEVEAGNPKRVNLAGFLPLLLSSLRSLVRWRSWWFISARIIWRGRRWRCWWSGGLSARLCSAFLVRLSVGRRMLWATVSCRRVPAVSLTRVGVPAIGSQWLTFFSWWCASWWCALRARRRPFEPHRIAAIGQDYRLPWDFRIATRH